MSETTKTIKKYLGYTVEPLKEAGRLSLGVIAGASTYYFIETILVLELVYAYTFALLGLITGYKIADPLASGIKSVGMGAYNAMINAKNWLTKTKPKVIVKSKVDEEVKVVAKESEVVAKESEVVAKESEVAEKAKVDEKEALENLDRTRSKRVELGKNSENLAKATEEKIEPLRGTEPPLPASLLVDIRRGREEESKNSDQAGSFLPVSSYKLFSSPAKVSGPKGTIEHLHNQLLKGFDSIGCLTRKETNQYDRSLGLLRPNFAGSLPQGPELNILIETKGPQSAKAFIKTALSFQENYIDFLRGVKNSLEVNTPDAYKPTESDNSPAYKKTFMDGDSGTAYQKYLEHFCDTNNILSVSDYEAMIECALLPISGIQNMTTEVQRENLEVIDKILTKSNALHMGTTMRELFSGSGDSEEDNSLEAYFPQ